MLRCSSRSANRRCPGSRSRRARLDLTEVAQRVRPLDAEIEARVVDADSTRAGAPCARTAARLRVADHEHGHVRAPDESSVVAPSRCTVLDFERAAITSRSWPPSRDPESVRRGPDDDLRADLQPPRWRIARPGIERCFACSSACSRAASCRRLGSTTCRARLRGAALSARATATSSAPPLAAVNQCQDDDIMKGRQSDESARAADRALHRRDDEPTPFRDDGCRVHRTVRIDQMTSPSTSILLVVVTRSTRACHFFVWRKLNAQVQWCRGCSRCRRADERCPSR